MLLVCPFGHRKNVCVKPEGASDWETTRNIVSCSLFPKSRIRNSCPVVFCKKRNFAKFKGRHLCESLFFNHVAVLRPATLLKKETLAQVFSCEFCENSYNTFFHKTLLVAASQGLADIIFHVFSSKVFAMRLLQLQAAWILFERLIRMTFKRIFILQMHPSKGCQKNILKACTFTQKKLRHRRFDNNFKRIFWKNTPENATSSVLLIVILMVGLLRLDS